MSVNSPGFSFWGSSSRLDQQARELESIAKSDDPRSRKIQRLSQYIRDHAQELFPKLNGDKKIKVAQFLDNEAIRGLSYRLLKLSNPDDIKKYFSVLDETIDRLIHDKNINGNFGIPLGTGVEKCFLQLSQEDQSITAFVQFSNGKVVACLSEGSPISARAILVDTWGKPLFLPLELSSALPMTSQGRSYCEALHISDVEARLQAYLQARGVPHDAMPFLTRKLLSVVIDNDLPVQQRSQIMDTVIRNTFGYLAEATRRIAEDLHQDEVFCHKFGLTPEFKIENISFLGNETHRSGKVPLLVTFKHLDQTIQVIYKPRSLLAESLICDSENSVFQHEGLGTYRIHHKNTHGYVEMLWNRRNENTFDSEESLNEYCESFTKIADYLEPLRVSDLHVYNGITHRKQMCLIDLEVAMIPPKMQMKGPREFVEETGAKSLWCWERENNLTGITPTMNQIWGTPQLEERCAAEHGMAFSRSETFASRIQNWPRHQLSEEGHRRVMEAREQLGREPNRVVLIDTVDLVNDIRKDLEGGWKNFKKQLVRGCEVAGLELGISDQDLRRMFEADVFNNDVPVFYYQDSTGIVSYGCGDKLVPIGRRLQ